MSKTTIEWADEVWNPVTGCNKVSAGCVNCYAEAIARRFWGDRKFTDIQLHPDRLDAPRQWKKPRRVFVNSMSDLFHPDVPDSFIRDVFSVMYQPENRKHTFMVLTKRPARMKEMFHYSPDLGDNVWLGVSVENQRMAEQRIPYLLETDTQSIRFISVEPMLGPVNLQTLYEGEWGEWEINSLAGYENAVGEETQGCPSIDWVICGCESGTGARPFNPDWARQLRDQCQDAGVPFFFKQGRGSLGFGKIRKMPELDGKVWNQFPKVQR